MNITGIITEYNPFHNGHLYHLTEAKSATKADGIVCIMSGNFEMCIRDRQNTHWCGQPWCEINIGII